MIKITAQMLRDKNACKNQVTIFEAEWPEGVEISQAAIHRAIELRLDLDWFVFHLATATAWKAYREVEARARRAYGEATASAWQEYQKAGGKAWATAWRIFNETRAMAICAAFDVQESGAD